MTDYTWPNGLSDRVRLRTLLIPLCCAVGFLLVLGCSKPAERPDPVVGMIALTNGQALVLTVGVKASHSFEFGFKTKDGTLVRGHGVLAPDIYSAFQAAVHIPGAHEISAYRPYFGPAGSHHPHPIQAVIDQVPRK